ncbi:MAG: hypothetical protein DRG78_13895 [Epsilonproteobacteria bacterium]|nr:MAG: hypothetical protein DRG78_13895 [Campylobacterota bacterium]
MYYKTVIKSIALISLLCTSGVYAEYGYDDGYSEPQKSIPARQVIIQNRKTITTLNKRVSELELRLDGLSSIVEGLNVTISDMKMSNTNISSTQAPSNNDNIKLIKELGVMIDKINASYVSKEELQKALNSKSIAVKGSLKVEPSPSSVDNKSTSKIYSEAVRLFVKKRYGEAEKRFTLTDSKGYKPAASNYYLGEISYYTKNYEGAVFYYKKSASLYDKASYMNVLLLHAGISLDKTGDKKQAKIFYTNVIENYPNKKSASIARSRLKKL